MAVHTPLASSESSSMASLAAMSKSPFIRTVASGVVLSQAAFALGKQAKEAIETRTKFTVSVRGDDVLYEDLQRWLLEQIPSQGRRSLRASLDRVPVDGGGVALSPGDGGGRPKRVLTLTYDGSRQQTVTLEGHRVAVVINKGDGNVNITSRDADWGSMLKAKDSLDFTASTRGGRDAILRFLDQVAAARNAIDQPPAFHVGTRWGGWTAIKNVPPRPLESVILEHGQRDRIINDLGAFLASEADYVRLGLPWHRGYLLAGVPGSGKTSMAKAIGGHFGLDVFSMSMSDIEEGDSALLGMITSVSPRSMLLIEDIDVSSASRDRDAEHEKGVSTAGLLNALDGIGTPHGLIVVMTTNRVEVLDQALVRSGRVDLHETVGLMGSEQAGRLLSYFYAREIITTLPEPITPADAVEVVKTHLNDPSGAVAAFDARFQATTHLRS